MRTQGLSSLLKFGHKLGAFVDSAPVGLVKKHASSNGIVLGQCINMRLVDSFRKVVAWFAHRRRHLVAELLHSSAVEVIQLRIKERQEGCVEALEQIGALAGVHIWMVA